MTNEAKIKTVKVLVDNDAKATDELVQVYLNDAESQIYLRMYPYGKPSSVNSVPERYEMLQCKLAARYFLRRGAEGEINHSENGVARTYSSTNDEDLLREVMQVLKVGRNA